MFHADNRWWHPVSNEDDVTDQPKRGKRVQIYLPADLIEQWEKTPRYERSAIVAAALRAWWDRQASDPSLKKEEQK